MAYDILPTLEHDTPEWHAARQLTLGASEVAAVLGLSPWQTPYSVYKAKLGTPNGMNPERAFIGHRAEVMLDEWIKRFHPEVGPLKPSFSAINPDYDWLSASPDRFADSAGLLIPVEMKTAQGYATDWKDGPPVYYQAQVQAQLLVFSAPYAWLALLPGDFTPRLYRVERDEDFLLHHLIPKTRKFWTNHVEARIAPDPSNLAEVNEVWPSAPGTEIEASDEALEAADRRMVLLSDIKAQTEEADALQFAIAQYMGTAETLIGPDGPVLTYKTQPGRRGVTDLDELERIHPEFVRRGDGFKVMRTVKRKALANV